MVYLALVPMMLNWLSDLSNWNLTLLPSESALALSVGPQCGSYLVAQVVHDLVPKSLQNMDMLPAIYVT